jgi:enamine deaminase RidA (YjgF/YER057c/UK114 family)
MSATSLFLNEAAERGFGYAQATELDGILRVSGTLALDDQFAPVCENDMAGQLECIYQRIAGFLVMHGAGLFDVLEEVVYVTDMDAMLAANGSRISAYDGHMPACTVVEVSRLAFPPCMAEIAVTVRIPG